MTKTLWAVKLTSNESSRQGPCWLRFVILQHTLQELPGEVPFELTKSHTLAKLCQLSNSLATKLRGDLQSPTCKDQLVEITCRNQLAENNVQCIAS